MPITPVNLAMRVLGKCPRDQRAPSALFSAMPSLGQRIRRLRNARSLSQRALAERLGIRPPSVAQWELGISRPDINRLPQLAEVLGVLVNTLMDVPDDHLSAQRNRLAALTADADLETLELLIRLAERLRSPKGSA